MTERKAAYMTEEEVRQRIESIVPQLHEAHHIEKEAREEDYSNSVEYHIENIIKGGGGIWNESFAEDYVRDLETLVGHETKIHGHFAP